jgi:hypothetical protein
MSADFARQTRTKRINVLGRLIKTSENQKNLFDINKAHLLMNQSTSPGIGINVLVLRMPLRALPSLKPARGGFLIEDRTANSARETRMPTSRSIGHALK